MRLHFDFTRYHIRLWDVEKHMKTHSYVLAAIYMDRTRGTGHVSADFELIEKDFARECSHWTFS